MTEVTNVWTDSEAVDLVGEFLNNAKAEGYAAAVVLITEVEGGRVYRVAGTCCAHHTREALEGGLAAVTIDIEGITAGAQH